MRTITVDTQGLTFSLKLLSFVGILALAWFSWGSVQHLFSNTTETAQALAPLLVSEEEQNDDVVRSGKSVDVDLDAMHVSLYEEREFVGSFDIEKAPKQNSPEHIPQGTYTVDEKTKTKLSSVTMVRFPFFIQFGDTYAIHGTPERADGGQLEGGYEGGLVELSTLDAERLYAFVEEGTTVVVRNTETKNSSITQQSMDVMYTDLPATSAQAYTLTDMVTGQLLLVKNGGDRFPIASITKLVTAAVATEVIGHGAQVRAPNGEFYTLSDLYYPLLLRSDNAVASGIAEHAGSTYFMSNMNAYVAAIGMTQTSFLDASGLSPKNISSALDLAILSHHLYTEKSFLLDITKEEDMTITSTNGVEWNVTNQNLLASDPYFRGGKLGYTDEAGQTSLAIFSVPLNGTTHAIAVVVLNSKDWKQDTRTLLRWLVENSK